MATFGGLAGIRQPSADALVIWLISFGASADADNDPDRLPSQAELEAIAEEIDGAAPQSPVRRVGSSGS